MSEEIKSSVRSFQPQFQNKQQLTGKPEYYRVNLSSGNKSSGGLEDALFHTGNIFPNHRTDLMNGEWEVFVESFHADFPDLLDGQVKLCLPELCHSSQNYVTTRTADFKSVFNVDDSVALLLVTEEFTGRTVRIDGEDAAELVRRRIKFTQRVNANDVGVKVDARALMSGRLRVVLRNSNTHGILDPRYVPLTQTYYVTLLFVHKP